MAARILAERSDRGGYPGGNAPGSSWTRIEEDTGYDSGGNAQNRGAAASLGYLHRGWSLPLALKINNQIQRQGEQRLQPDDTQELILQPYALSGRDLTHDGRRGRRLLLLPDRRVALPGERLSSAQLLAAVVRVIAFQPPDPCQLGIPDLVLQLGNRPKGLVLVNHPAGSGKSTTLACIIDRINQSRNCHVVTLETPSSISTGHNRSIISQREIATDTESYGGGPAAPPCARRPMSSCWARCGTARPSASP